MANHDPWKPSTGLTEEYSGRINDAWFEIDLDYNADTVLLKVEIVGESVPDGARIESYTVGKVSDFEIADGGKAIVRSNGSSTPPNENSKVGRLMTAALEVAGDELRSRGLPTEAKTWVGLDFDWVLDRKTFPGLTKDDGTPVVSQAMLPVAFNGASGKAESPAPTEPDVSGADVSGVSAEARAAVIRLVKASSNYDEFIDKAFTNDAVIGNEAVEQWVLDEKGGAWGTFGK